MVYGPCMCLYFRETGWRHLQDPQEAFETPPANRTLIAGVWRTRARNGKDVGVNISDVSASKLLAACMLEYARQVHKPHSGKLWRKRNLGKFQVLKRRLYWAKPKKCRSNRGNFWQLPLFQVNLRKRMCDIKKTKKRGNTWMWRLLARPLLRKNDRTRFFIFSSRKKKKDEIINKQTRCHAHCPNEYRLLLFPFLPIIVSDGTS